MMKPIPPIEAAIDSPMVGLCPSDADSAATQAPEGGLAVLLAVPPAPPRRAKRAAEKPAEVDHVEWGPSVGNGAPEVAPAPPSLMGMALKWWRR